MNVDRAIHVRQVPYLVLEGGRPCWSFRCDLCDDQMDFGDWGVAVEWAQRHGMKHDEQACPTCGHRPYIREDFQ